jgi:hypothetical protein
METSLVAWHDEIAAALFRFRLRQKFRGRTEKRQRISNPWHAVSVVPGLHSCAAADALRDRRMLAADAPALPLPDCQSPRTCTCRYRHHADRRSGPRRARDSGFPDRPFKGGERRGPTRGRRTTDL